MLGKNNRPTFPTLTSYIQQQQNIFWEPDETDWAITNTLSTMTMAEINGSGNLSWFMGEGKGQDTDTKTIWCVC